MIVMIIGVVDSEFRCSKVPDHFLERRLVRGPDCVLVAAHMPAKSERNTGRYPCPQGQAPRGRTCRFEIELQRMPVPGCKGHPSPRRFQRQACSMTIADTVKTEIGRELNRQERYSRFFPAGEH